MQVHSSSNSNLILPDLIQDWTRPKSQLVRGLNLIRITSSSQNQIRFEPNWLFSSQYYSYQSQNLLPLFQNSYAGFVAVGKQQSSQESCRIPIELEQFTLSDKILLELLCKYYSIATIYLWHCYLLLFSELHPLHLEIKALRDFTWSFSVYI